MEKPFAEKLRPENLNDFVGQTHIVGESGPIKNFIEKNHIQSMIFWGPPGTGKTTLAKIISKLLNITYLSISATDSGTKELKEIANKSKAVGRMLLFIDEIHRFNKLQQDVLLPHIERGNLVIIGSTTENPSFSVNKAILSRCISFKFNPLSNDDIYILLEKASEKLSCDLTKETLKKLSYYSEGDGRKALNLFESIYFSGEENFDFLKSNPVYDRNSDEHYNHASALQKSIRGSDPDASIYWLSKMIAAGEPLEFIARRLMIIASEDIGNANPMAAVLANSIFNTVKNIGMPEGKIPLAQLVIFLAKSEKSNEAINSINEALSDINQGKSYKVPIHLQDSHYKGSEEIAGVKGYIYSHQSPFDFQTFMPNELLNKKYVKEEELKNLPKNSENNLMQILKKSKSSKIDFEQLKKESGYEIWKIKKALRFLVKVKKIKINRGMDFQILK